MSLSLEYENRFNLITKMNHFDFKFECNVSKLYILIQSLSRVELIYLKVFFIN